MKLDNKNRPAMHFCLGIVLFIWGGLVQAQTSYGPVKPGETVYSILRDRNLSQELNLRQWALATLAINPGAFGQDVGELRTGARLRLPSLDQARSNWRRGLAMELGQLPVPDLPKPIVPAVGATESQVPVPQPQWRVEDAPPPAAIPSPAPIATAQSTGELPSANESTSEPSPAAGLPELGGVQLATGPFRDEPLYAQVMARAGATVSANLLEQLLTLEEVYAGDADYDYALGVLLLDAGRPQDALFPLLRASQSRPQSLGIRMDLGRAYFDANDNESARLIFEQLKAQNPPPATAQIIDSYVEASTRRASRYSPTLVSRISLSGGYDSNANAATDLRNFLGFELDEQARSAESGFAQLDLQGQYAHPLEPRWRWLAGADARYRNYFDAKPLNALQLGASTGLSYRRGGYELSGRIGGDWLQIDGEDNATNLGLTLGWNAQLSPFTRLQTSARLGALRYADNLAIRDVDQWLLALGLTRRGQWGLGTEMALTVLGGQDRAVENQSPYGRDIGGLQINLAVQLSPRSRLFASAQGLIAPYDGLFFGIEREDVLWSTVWGLELEDNRLPGWMLVPSLSYSDNQSDVALYEYERLLVSLRLSRSFN